MNTEVIIIGAGPTGLMAACQLARYGISFIIVDSKAIATSESRAMLVTARSMEIYDQKSYSPKTGVFYHPQAFTFIKGVGITGN